jgi:carbon storage regulator
MLVLTRKQDESILIGEGVVVTVHALKSSRVVLRIEAPKEVKILRGELTECESRPEG